MRVAGQTTDTQSAQSTDTLAHGQGWRKGGRGGRAERKHTHPDWTVAQALGVAWFGAALSDIAQDLAAQHTTRAHGTEDRESGASGII